MKTARYQVKVFAANEDDAVLDVTVEVAAERFSEHVSIRAVGDPRGDEAGDPAIEAVPLQEQVRHALEQARPSIIG